jgi:hypothetical protein
MKGNTMLEADNVISRLKNLKEHTVFRNIDSIPLMGVIPYDLKHTMGGPLEVTLLALNQQEAEQAVDIWLESDPA